jgi:hypothetical protein
VPLYLGRLDPRSLDVAPLLEDDPPEGRQFAYSPANRTFLMERSNPPKTALLYD